MNNNLCIANEKFSWVNNDSSISVGPLWNKTRLSRIFRRDFSLFQTPQVAIKSLQKSLNCQIEWKGFFTFIRIKKKFEGFFGTANL